MPIRFVDKTAVVAGRIQSTIAHTALISATFTVVPARTGSIATTMGGHSTLLSGAFTSNANRVGAVAQTLAGVTSAFSGTFAQPSNQAPQWASSVDQTPTVGVPFSLNLDTICTDPEGQPLTYTIVSGTLPAGITQSGARGQTISGTATTIGSSAVTFRANDIAADADWLTRSTASGVFYANNFTYRDTAKTQLITSDTDLRNSAAQTGGTLSTVVRNTTQFLSGTQSLKLNMPASSGQYGGWNFDFGGIAVSSKLVVKHQFYFQFAYYVDSVFYNFFPGVFNTYGGKIAIIQAPDQSFGTGEVVLRRLPIPGGYVAAYRIPASSGLTQYFQLNIGSDAHFNNFIDRGGSTATENARQLRFGINYDRKDNTSDTDIDVQHSPRYVANGWYVFEVYVDQINDVVKIWGAPYGSAPTLVMGAMDAGLPPSGTISDGGINPQPLYTGIQLTNYPNTWTNYPSTTTFVGYDELICSTNPINFPGGFSLPFPGTATPTGYPPSGTSEN